MSWKTLGTVAPTELVDARLQAHYAAQVVASAGVSFLEPQADDSHPNMGWVESLGALVGRPLPGAGAQAGLRIDDLTLLIVDASGQVREQLVLGGETLEEGYAWLAAATARAGSALPAAGARRAGYQLPDHATARGTAFSATPRPAFAELARWLANGHHVLTDFTRRVPDASELRCWPHHSDLGALAAVATQPDSNLAKSIGIGLSPGDDDYPEPYWYVSPWPYPEPAGLPELEAGGHWHTEGFTSAILTGGELLAGPIERLSAFLDGAIAASRRALAD